MKRTTIQLPDDLDYQLRYEAARRQMTVSELTQEAIEQHLGVGKRRKLLATGAGRSGQHDISERIEELLREELRPSHSSQTQARCTARQR